MDNNFITNDDVKDLKKCLVPLVQKSDELKFLAGFFYFPGVRGLRGEINRKGRMSLRELGFYSCGRRVVGSKNYGFVK